MRKKNEKMSSINSNEKNKLSKNMEITNLSTEQIVRNCEKQQIINCKYNSSKQNVIKIDNYKLIDQINLLFHSKGIKQENRLDLLIDLLMKNNNVKNKFKDIDILIKNLNTSNYDLIQEIFMTIGSKETKFNLDQFYTPLTIPIFINQFMNSENNKSAIDPAGGTGDLLLFFKGRKTIWDIDHNSLKLCKFNYELNKLSNYNLICKNSLLDFNDDVSKYDYCVMNPPFGIKNIITDDTILNKFELGKGKKNQEIGILFLELGLKLLKNDGILFIVVPSGYVGNTNNKYNEMRNFILQNKLIASISLPENTFKRSGTGVNTYLLIIQKLTPNNNTKSYPIFLYDVKNIGYNLTKKNTPLKYKIVKETGEVLNNLDNDLEINSDCSKSLFTFIKDNRIKNLNLSLSNDTHINQYQYAEKDKLYLNIFDIKRYLQEYKNVIRNLVDKKAVKLNSLSKVITSSTTIVKTKIYKYIDISEINSPLYSYKSLYGWELPKRAKCTLRKNDILISKLEGKFSYCVILDDTDNYIATNGVCVIRPNDVNCLYLLFSNILTNNFALQHKSHITGSIMASLTDKDVKNFLIDIQNVNIESVKNTLNTLELLFRQNLSVI